MALHRTTPRKSSDNLSGSTFAYAAMETLWSAVRLTRRLGLPDRGLTATAALTSSFYETLTIRRIEVHADKAVKREAS
jgi:hypothetical protein